MENNTVKITGKIMETPEYLLTSQDRRKIYKSTIEVMRTSGNMDVIPIQVPEQIVQQIRDNVGGRITIFGEYRSYNEKDGERNHLKLYVFVKGISEAGEADQNRIDLIGYICKQPLYRETPLGKEITDILIAVNRKHRKSDYLPAICWYSNARLAAELPVGTKVRTMGMIQSRIYVKGDSERTAYEVSIREMEVIE